MATCRTLGTANVAFTESVAFSEAANSSARTLCAAKKSAICAPSWINRSRTLLLCKYAVTTDASTARQTTPIDTVYRSSFLKLQVSGSKRSNTFAAFFIGPPERSARSRADVRWEWTDPDDPRCAYTLRTGDRSGARSTDARFLSLSIFARRSWRGSRPSPCCRETSRTGHLAWRAQDWWNIPRPHRPTSSCGSAALSPRRRSPLDQAATIPHRGPVDSY